LDQTEGNDDERQGQEEPSESPSEDSHAPPGLDDREDGDDVETLVDFVSGKVKNLQVSEEGAAESESPAAGGGGKVKDEAAFVWTPSKVNETFRERNLRPVGEVVAIVELSPRRDHVVCSILMDREKRISNADRVVLRPIDEKFPLLLIDKKTTSKKPFGDPAKLCEELEASRDKFVLVKMTRWTCSNMRPYCQVVEILGEMANMDSQVSAFLTQQGIQQTHLQDFSEEVMACLPKTPWSISEEEVQARRDLRDWRIFSIDPETARDLDDALSVEMVDEGTARIGVHIADVTHFVRAATSLDEEASRRATSVYMVDSVLPMLPRLLCEELCSLNPGTDRLAFSIIWDVEVETCEIKSQWLGKSIIRSCAKLHYGQAQEIIEGADLTSVPHLHAFTLEEVTQDVKLLDRIAKQLRERRFANGALTLNIPRVSIVLDDEKKPVGAKQYVQRDSNYLVEEFMLLANRRVAEFISEKIPIAAVLRRHPPPHARKIEALRKMTEKMNISIETQSSKAIHNSLERIKSEAEDHIFHAIVLLTTKPMQNALYFCTGAPDYENHSEKWAHYALAMDRYTHFTSPIRRYADVMVHRLISDVLAKERQAEERQSEKKEKKKGNMKGQGKMESFESTGTKRSPWGKKFTEKVVEQCMQCNRQKLAAKSVQEDSIKLYLAIWLNSHPYDTEGVILDLNGPKWMGVFVPEFGMEFKVYWEDDKRLKTTWDGNNKQMKVFERSDNDTKDKEKKRDKDNTKLLFTLKNFESTRVTLVSSFKEKSCTYEISAKLNLAV
jgi:DIS3-like exonuclease 2